MMILAFCASDRSSAMPAELAHKARILIVNKGKDDKSFGNYFK